MGKVCESRGNFRPYVYPTSGRGPAYLINLRTWKEGFYYKDYGLEQRTWDINTTNGHVLEAVGKNVEKWGGDSRRIPWGLYAGCIWLGLRDYYISRFFVVAIDVEMDARFARREVGIRRLRDLPSHVPIKPCQSCRKRRLPLQKTRRYIETLDSKSRNNYALIASLETRWRGIFHVWS